MLDKLDTFLEEPMVRRFLFFDEMLTPSLVRIAYWLCLLAIAWTGLEHMFSGGFGHFVEGIVQIIMGAILARIAAELIMVLFKLNEKMGIVAENTKPAAVVSTPANKVAGKTTNKASKRATKKVTKES